MREVKVFDVDGTVGELRQALNGLPDGATVRVKGHPFDMNADGPAPRRVTIALPAASDTK